MVNTLYLEPSISKFGHNEDVDGNEDIWNGGGLYPFPTSSAKLSIASLSDEDKSGGTGASAIEIYGLGDGFVSQNEAVTLNGLTPVQTALSYYRVNRMYIIGAVGSNNTNVNNINATHPVAGIISQIHANDGQTEQAIYTVPANLYGYVQQVYAHVEGLSTATVKVALYRRVNLGGDASGWRLVRRGTAKVDSPFLWDATNANSSVNGGDDFRLTVISTSAINTEVSGGFSLKLFESR